jgi:hypothetical protein
MPPHERKIQGPPRNAQERHPDKLLFQEKLEQGNAAVQRMLDGRNVGPAPVVAGYEIPVLPAQAFSAANAPFNVVKYIGQQA